MRSSLPVKVTDVNMYCNTLLADKYTSIFNTHPHPRLAMLRCVYPIFKKLSTDYLLRNLGFTNIVRFLPIAEALRTHLVMGIPYNDIGKGDCSNRSRLGLVLVTGLTKDEVLDCIEGTYTLVNDYNVCTKVLIKGVNREAAAPATACALMTFYESINGSQYGCEVEVYVYTTLLDAVTDNNNSYAASHSLSADGYIVPQPNTTLVHGYAKVFRPEVTIVCFKEDYIECLEENGTELSIAYIGYVNGGCDDILERVLQL